MGDSTVENDPKEESGSERASPSQSVEEQGSEFSLVITASRFLFSSVPPVIQKESWLHYFIRQMFVEHLPRSRHGACRMGSTACKVPALMEGPFCCIQTDHELVD